jgi:uncharacterized membrane protein
MLSHSDRATMDLLQKTKVQLLEKMKKEFNLIFLISIVGNIGLVAGRIIYTHEGYYAFLLWNLFLAAIPLFISRIIIRIRFRKSKMMLILLGLWILFIPNAPYIITDFVHLYNRPPVPLWYDLVLLLICALNGLILGFISIGHIESYFFKDRYSKYLVLFRLITVIAMSYGVFVGRYLRFNSWDAIINPITLSRGMYHSICNSTLGFVLVFSFLIFILYGLFRSILPFRTQEVF